MTAQIEDLWIRNLRPAPDAAVRLVGFPHAGGSAGFCLTVSRTLALGVDAFVRRDRRTEPVGTDIGEPAGRIADDLAARADDRPIVLFGHGMGASVTFEAVRRLADGTAPLARPVLAPGGEVRGRGRHTSVGFGREVLTGGRLSLVREQAASPLPVAG
ncbi:thioesterase domain-containing protein [Streptomyces sp. NPDC003314]